MIHPGHQMDMSPFPDLSADFNNAFWNLEAMGMANNNFFDPMSSYFVPFNVDPPTMGDDGAFAQANAEAYGFALGAGTPVDLDLMHGHPGGGGMRTGHRQSIGGRPGMQRRGTGSGME